MSKFVFQCESLVSVTQTFSICPRGINYFRYSLTTYVNIEFCLMYAVIEMGGKQYRVEPEQILYVEKTGFEKGSDFDIKNVLLVEKDNKVSFGKPILTNVSIKAKILDDVRAPKIVGFKYKSKKNYRRRWGHRQNLQKIQITAITA